MNTATATANARHRTVMEHRWGVRVELDHEVRLRIGNERFGGRLRNASISGALIATDSAPPLLAAVELAFTAHIHGEPRLICLPARVVRLEYGYLGIEWCDMACRPIVELLRAAQSGAEIFARDRAFS